MKKLFLILVVAFAGVATFSYANSLANSSAVLLAQNTCPTFCFLRTVSLKSQNNGVKTFWRDADLYSSGNNYYIGIGNSKYLVTTVSRADSQVVIEGKTYYFAM